MDRGIGAPPLWECDSPSCPATVQKMAHATVISPQVFVEHTRKLRARQLEQVAAEVEQSLRIRLVPPEQVQRTSRNDLSSVLRHFRSKLR